MGYRFGGSGGGGAGGITLAQSMAAAQAEVKSQRTHDFLADADNSVPLVSAWVGTPQTGDILSVIRSSGRIEGWTYNGVDFGATPTAVTEPASGGASTYFISRADPADVSVPTLVEVQAVYPGIAFGDGDLVEVQGGDAREYTFRWDGSAFSLEDTDRTDGQSFRVGGVTLDAWATPPDLARYIEGDRVFLWDYLEDGTLQDGWYYKREDPTNPGTFVWAEDSSPDGSTGGGGSSTTQVQQNGTTVLSTSTLNFTGSVSVTDNAGVADVNLAPGSVDMLTTTPSPLPLTATDIANGYVDLPSTPTDPESVLVDASVGISWVRGTDFTLAGARITWEPTVWGPAGTNPLSVGDTLSIRWF